MTVPQLRKAVCDLTTPHSVVNGKPVYKMPNGTLVSKAKKAELEQYLADLHSLGAPTHEIVEAPAASMSEAEMSEAEATIARCNNRIRKFSKRRQTPNNVRLVKKFTDKRDKAIRELQQGVANAA